MIFPTDEEPIKIICGDCKELIKNISEKSIDLIIIDPPYLIKHLGGGLREKREYHEKINQQGLNKGYDFNIFNDFFRILKKINIICFCSKEQLFDYLKIIHEQKLNWVLICWHKKNPIPAINNTYLPDTE